MTGYHPARRSHYAGGMTHKSVESVIGKLATDEGFRRRFLEDPPSTLDALRREGWELTAVEIQGLVGIDSRAIDRFARIIDRRLQKADLALPDERPT